jgi:hypothetical protein
MFKKYIKINSVIWIGLVLKTWNLGVCSSQGLTNYICIVGAKYEPVTVVLRVSIESSRCHFPCWVSPYRAKTLALNGPSASGLWGWYPLD